jgi:hypothetical protein
MWRFIANPANLPCRWNFAVADWEYVEEK